MLGIEDFGKSYYEVELMKEQNLYSIGEVSKICNVSKMKFKYFIQYSTKMRIDHFQINTHYRFMNKLLIHRKLQVCLRVL